MEWKSKMASDGNIEVQEPQIILRYSTHSLSIIILIRHIDVEYTKLNFIPLVEILFVITAL